MGKKSSTEDHYDFEVDYAGGVRCNTAVIGEFNFQNGLMSDRSASTVNKTYTYTSWGTTGTFTAKQTITDNLITMEFDTDKYKQLVFQSGTKNYERSFPTDPNLSSSEQRAFNSTAQRILTDERQTGKLNPSSKSVSFSTTINPKHIITPQINVDTIKDYSGWQYLTLYKLPFFPHLTLHSTNNGGTNYSITLDLYTSKNATSTKYTTLDGTKVTFYVGQRNNTTGKLTTISGGGYITGTIRDGTCTVSKTTTSLDNSVYLVNYVKVSFTADSIPYEAELYSDTYETEANTGTKVNIGTWEVSRCILTDTTTALGSPVQQLHKLYAKTGEFSGNLTAFSGKFNGNVSPENAIGGDLGEAYKRWNTLYACTANIRGSIVPVSPASNANSYSTRAYKCDLGALTTFTCNGTQCTQRWDNVYAYNGDFSGTVKTASGTVAKSDRSIKNTIQLIADDSRYEKLYDSLQPVSYKLNNGTSGRTHTGLIAQDLKQSILDAGLTTTDVAAYCEWEEEDPKTGEKSTTCGIRYEELIPLNIYEIKRLKKRVADQETRIAALEEIIKNLKTK